MTLTDHQARLLTALTRSPMPRDVAEDRYHRQTITSALDRGWITPDRDHLTLTDPGRKALNDHLDAPRLLTPSARPAHTERGYTDQPGRAIRDEPEAIDEATQQQFSERAEIRDRQRKTQRSADRDLDRDRLALEDRIAKAHRDARLEGVDVRSEFRALERMRDAQQSTNAVVQQLRRIEAAVDRKAA